ncbi:MAG: AraC family transcriptional regulator [Cyanobacteria bacterium P01_E01_bin.6]
MAIALTDTDLEKMWAQAGQRDGFSAQPSEFEEQCRVPDCLGSGLGRTLTLRNGMTMDIGNVCFKQPVGFIHQHESAFPLVAKFFLAGESRVQTLDAPDINSDYREVAGCHYLYHLPDLTEVEGYPADERIHLIRIMVNPTFFQAFSPGGVRLAAPLQKLLEGDRTQCFHQPLGRTTPVMRELLKQILHCPYQGLMQQLYLESKALELFAAQFALWTDAPPSAPAIALSAQDIEQLHHARDILVQHSQHPPSLKDLAHQVNLNDRKLNQGFRHLFGNTVFGYLQEYRLQQAKDLLHDPAFTIANVATKVGYKNPEAFSTAFRRKFSVSPKAYQLSRRAG